MDKKRLINILVSIIPKGFRVAICQIFLSEGVIYRSFHDAVNYLRFSRTFSHNSLKRIESEMVVNYHTLEKGLSFKMPKFHFGVDRIKIIIKLLDEFIRKGYDINNIFYNSAVSVLQEYVQWHKLHNKNVSWLEDKIKKYPVKAHKLGGTIQVRRDAYLKSGKGNFEDLAHSRKSIRDYTKKNVDLSIIKKAIELAQLSPSACNRQPARVYVVNNKDKLYEVLQLQNGNRGFSKSINKVLVVCADSSVYRGSTELFAPLVDGGVFAMSLVYSLQYYGLGTCILNWFSSMRNDKKLHKILGIPSSEKVILLIAVGHLPRTLKVTKSTKKPAKDIINII